MRSASATVVIPSLRSCSPETTVTEDGVRSAGSGDLVAVTSTGCETRRIRGRLLRAQGAGQRERGERDDRDAEERVHRAMGLSVKEPRADQARGRERSGISAGAPTAGSRVTTSGHS